MNASYTWIFTVSSILHAVLVALMLAVVWIGWKRTKRFGFLVLVGWGCVSLFNALGYWLWYSVGQRFLAQWFPTASVQILTVLPNLLAGWVSSLLLLAGLVCLVFDKHQLPKPPAD